MPIYRRRPVDRADAQRLYDEAVYNRDHVRRQVDYAKDRQESVQSKLQFVVKDKYNLESRLSDLNRIIRFFDETLESQTQAAKSAAEKANNAYHRAICSTSSASSIANIATIFDTDSVSGNADTANARLYCIQERDRIQNEISDLQVEINQLNRDFEDYSDDLRRYGGLEADYQGCINYYASFL